MSAPRVRLLPLVPEALLALAVAASFAWTLHIFFDVGYLPQPFVFDTNDTFMDWFNTAYWANNRGIYDVWRSIYPPLSFVFLDATSLPGCYLQSSFYARDCDWLARSTIYAFYVFDVVLAWVCFRRLDRRTAPMRTVAIALGLPMFAYAVKRDWRTLEVAGVATVALYLVTLALVGAGTPAELASNTANWVVFQGGQVWNEVNYSTSYAPLLMFRTLDIPLLQFVPSRLIETIEFLVPIVIRAGQLLALAALAAAWLQPKALPAHRIAAILLGAYLATQSPGGYTQLFLIFLVLLEPWKGAGPVTAIACAYLLCLVGDWPLATVLDVTGVSWLGERTVTASFGLTAGHFIRPGLIVILVGALSLDSIARVVRAHRSERPTLGLVAA